MAEQNSDDPIAPGVEEPVAAFKHERSASDVPPPDARRLTLEAGRRAMDKHAEALAELAK